MRCRMDEGPDEFYDDGFGLGTNYYLYVLAATVVCGLPLLFLALFKIYADHQRNLQERAVHKEMMQEYQDAKKGLTASLRCEVNSTRANYEMERMEREHKERQIRLDHGKKVQELESKIRSLERQLKSKNVQLEETVVKAQETLRTANAVHSRELREAHDTIAHWECKCEDFKEQLAQSARQAREEYRRLDERYQRERVGRGEDQQKFDARIRGLESHNISLEGQLRDLKNKLARAEERLKEAQRGWRFPRIGSSHNPVSTAAETDELATPPNPAREGGFW